MASHAFHFSLLLLLLLFFLIFPRTPAAADPPAYQAVDRILLDCGSSTNLNDLSGRTWYSEERSRYAPANSPSISTASGATHSVNKVPYDTARVIHSNFTYSFPVSTGHKFIRLYFYPDSYPGFNTSQSLFSVTANGFTLLSNFSAFSTYLSHPDEPSFEKEYIINVKGDQKLNLTFSPNPNSFAFINGIEIVSLPDELYFNHTLIKFVPDSLFGFSNDTALETLYRLNIGGASVQIQDDTGMFRSWDNDEKYILGGNFGYTPHDEDHPINYTLQTPAYIAPKIVYRTSRVVANESKNLQWSFPVDSGFYYLFRLHFCEIQLEVTKQNQRVFTINIGNQTAEREVDVIFRTGNIGTGIPIYRDYISWVPNDGRRGKTDVWLTLFPNNEGQPMYSNALLNGLEIFKLSDSSNRSLAAANPNPASPPTSNDSPTPAPVTKKSQTSSVIFAVVGSVIGVVAVVAAVCFLIFRRQQKVEDSISTKSSWMHLPSSRTTTTTRSGSGTPLPSNLCRHFTLGEMIAATRAFDDNFMIGKGGFGNVYKGLIDNNTTTVAVKRLNASSSQGAREFVTEIQMLSKLRHLHLVSLIGYCNYNGEMILVYDYMAHGTLREHLYGNDNPPLTWKQRLQICHGAAKGLEYLHTGAEDSIIHRDVKSTNILLDEKWEAKVSDFGLSKVGPTQANTHVSTAVKGSFGYIDPEYWRMQQLTDKSDVYSFGVVLFEVLCARPAIQNALPREKVNLGEWAKTCRRKGTIDQIIDPNLKGQIAPASLNRFVETAIDCLKPIGTERPAMTEVGWRLKLALDLQEEAEKGNGSFASPTTEFPLLGRKDPATTDEDVLFSGTSETVTWSKSSGLPSSGSSEKLNSVDVFSEIRNPTGR